MTRRASFNPDLQMFTPTAAIAPEEPLQIRLDDADLHGVLHRAAGPARGAVLICAPDGEERWWAFRPLLQLARILALRQQDVLRFDYEGQGESSGLYEHTDVASRVRNITSAARELRQRSGFAGITVVAARLGAAFALEATAADPRIRRLALWEPVLDVEGYLRNLLRVNVTAQMVVHKKVLRNSEQLLHDLAAGATVSVNGYKLSQGFVTGLQDLEASQRLAVSRVPALLIASAATKIPDTTAELRRRAFGPFWKEPKSDMTPPQLLLKEIADWVESVSNWRRAPVTPPALNRLPTTGEPVSFVCEGCRLVGSLHRPETAIPRPAWHRPAEPGSARPQRNASPLREIGVAADRDGLHRSPLRCARRRGQRGDLAGRAERSVDSRRLWRDPTRRVGAGRAGGD